MALLQNIIIGDKLCVYKLRAISEYNNINSMDSGTVKVITSDDPNPIIVPEQAVNAMEYLKSTAVVTEGDVELFLFRSRLT